jgi:phosphoribosylglycinamide formyltransferase-1
VPLRVGVLASGSGTLLQAIIDGQDESYRVAVVVADRAGVVALDRAARAGIDTAVVEYGSFESRDDFSKGIAAALRARDVELVCSAGFMRILSPSYFAAVGVPTLNSHPALLPAFPGAHGVREALEWGAKVAGTTIHFIDEEVDHGPIVAQEATPVRADDTEETLHERIKEIERRLYPEVIRWYASGRLKVEGRRVHVIG